MKFLTLIFMVIATFAVASSVLFKDKACSPWLGQCLVYEDCCRYLECSTYQARCIPIEGIIVPGQDKRPIGGGPFPPGYPNNFLR